MEDFMNTLYSKLRDDVNSIGKLDKITNEKLRAVIQRSNISKQLQSMAFKDIFGTCWMWEGQTTTPHNGHCHGVIWHGQNYVMVHRLMYHNFIGDVPVYTRCSTTQQINHTCTDNDGTCFNPCHLYLGTPKQNTEDAVLNGTLNRHSTKSKLTDNVVQELIDLRNEGYTRLQLAEYYEVTVKTIGDWLRKFELLNEEKYGNDLKQQVVTEKLLGKTYNDIIQQYNVSKSSIVRWVREHKKT